MGVFNRRDRVQNEVHPCKRIVVASGARGVGVSFVSELIAYGLVKHGSVSVTELGSPYFYDSLGFEKNFLVRGYKDFFGKIKEGEHIDYISSDSNSFDNINWIAKMPGDTEPLSAARLFRAYYMPSESFAIFDCSGLDKESSQALLAEADYPVCVIDPLPSKLFQSFEFLESLRISLPDACLVVNKMNPGVHANELNRFLGTKNYFSIISVASEYIYKSEYNSMSFCKLPALADYMSKTQDMLSKLFF